MKPCLRPLLVCLALAFLASPALAQGKKYALLVGVKEYEHSSLSDLKHTENDVEELAKLLKEGGFTQVVLMTTSLGKKDAGAKPTAANIRAQLKKLSGKVTKHDLLVVGLAGHGLQISLPDPKTKRDRDESFFCPTDARPRAGEKLDELKKSMIPLFELFKELDDSGAGVRLMLVDACRNDPKMGRNMDVDNLPKPTRGTAVLFSCKGGEKAFESDKLGKGHGIFFHHVIEGLKGKAKNDKGEVTWSRLAEYVIDKVSDEVPLLIGDGARQTPQEVKNLEGKPPVLMGRLTARKGTAWDRAVDHFVGITGNMDSKSAAALFREADESGHEAAPAALAWLTYTGNGVPQDRAAGIRRLRDALPGLKRSAEGGDAFAMVLLAAMMSHGAGIERDPAGSVAWLRKAAAKKHPRGFTDLGLMYGSGQGVDLDQKEALRLYRLGAEGGDAEGMCLVAGAYEYGRGVEKDEAEALRWYGKAAEKAHAGAMSAMGNAHYTGWGGIKKDARAAVAWYRKAAARENAHAMRGLGNAYFDGQGVEQDDREALRWYRLAAARNHARSMHSVGWMLEHGRGVEKDHEEALRWYRKSAAAGDPNGLTALGNALSTGWAGAEKDEKESARLYRLAADKGHAEAMFKLAGLYEDGRGVAQDSTEALRWYKLAAARGHQQARDKVKQLES